MPQFQVTTKEAKSVWRSPDGQREIFDVVLDYDGSAVTASTYSKEIATVGWAGTVDTYEKEGKGGRPPQTFVKQPPKEGGGYSTPSGTSGYSKGSYIPKDEKAIQAMWAIGQAVQLTVPSIGKGDIDVVGTVYQRAVELFSMVEAVKESDKDTDTATQPDKLDEVAEVPEETPDDLLKDVENAFPGTTKATTAEKPWAKH